VWAAEKYFWAAGWTSLPEKRPKYTENFPISIQVWNTKIYLIGFSMAFRSPGNAKLRNLH
jgi:hypothetical protein